MNMSEFSRFLGVAMTTLRKHMRAGTIPYRQQDENYIIDVEEAVHAWRQNVDPEWQPAKKFLLEQKVLAEAGENPGKKPKEGTKAYADWRKEKEKWAAKKARIEYEFKAGDLVEADKVKKIAFETGRVARDSLMALPDRLSHELAAEMDPKKISLRLEEELVKALDEIYRVPDKLKKLTEEILKRKRGRNASED